MGAVRKAFDDRLDNPRFIETRWAEGYRFIGPVEERFADGDVALPEIEGMQGVKIVIEEEEIQEAGPSISKESAPQLVAESADAARRRSNRRVAFLLGFATLALAAAGLGF